MWKQCRVIVVALTLAAWMALPNAAMAVSYEDSLDDCSYPKMTDLYLMRPLGFFTLVGSSMLWIASSPLYLLTAPGDMDDVTNTLVHQPFRFTFNRPLGECSAAELSHY